MAIGFDGWRYNTGFSQATGIPTPELRITETLGKILGATTDVNRGSDISGSYLGAAGLPGGTQTPSSQFNTAYQAQPYYTSSTSPKITQASGGGGTTPTGTLPTGAETPTGVPSPDYSAYFADLDRQINELGGQRASQEQIAQNTYDQGMNTLNSQLTQGKADLESNQQKTLRDLAQSMRQSWQQGNAMLGTRGASDSSAAGHYAYALTKFGNQQRGDVQNQYQGQLFKLQNTYDTEVKNLELDKSTKLQQIAQWFAEAQNSLRNQVGQGKLQANQQAYQVALQMMQQVQQQSAAKQTALQQWALDRATTVQEAAKAMGLFGNTQVQNPGMTGLFSNQAPQQRQQVATGYGYNQQKYDQFGNPIS